MTARAPLPEAVRHPEPGSVLVLAPHADDEIIGCGGTLALHVEQGDRVSVLVCFDGARGDPDRLLAPGEVAERRRAEARAAGAHLGVCEYEFWSYPEGHEPRASELDRCADRLAAHVRSVAPSTIYVPWIGEHHLDHHVLARAAEIALARAQFRGRAYGYEVWTPLLATLVVDITPVIEEKREALLEHKSQLAYQDLVHQALGLNAQRSIYLARGARYGEGFARFRFAQERDEDRPRHRSLSA